MRSQVRATFSAFRKISYNPARPTTGICYIPVSKSYHDNRGNNGNHSEKGEIPTDIILGIGGGLLFTAWLSLEKSNRHADCASSATAASFKAVSKHDCDRVIDRLPTFRQEEVGKHYDSSSRVWVSYRYGVYDVTDFIEKHPGGDRLLMAAGGSLETFWELYPVHQKENVFQILEKYRIGNLHPQDVEEAKSQITSMPDTFVGEPKRLSLFKARSTKPFNGETPPSLLTAKFHTPNDLFYVRNHLPVPAIDLKAFSLEVEGLRLPKGKQFSIDDIKKLPKKEISATIQCGGNRRSEMSSVKSVHGLAWTGGAIGNAKWGGAKLMDVLKLSGFDWNNYPEPDKLHIQFEGLDSDVSGESYGASIPLCYLKDDNFEAVIAYEMNDEPLPLDHGFPLRIIVPGIVGARNVKWLSKIVISNKESQSPWQQRDYKVFNPSVTLETVDYSSSPAIQDTPVTSYLCSHEDNQTIPKGPTTLEGYAFSGGGRGIIRVEISTDEGKTWAIADIVAQDEKKGYKNWAWVLWKYPVNLSKPGKCQVWVRAIDTGYNQQAENMESIWNYRGLLTTAYHRVSLNVN